MRKVLSLEQQRLIQGPGESVSEAISEVQPCWMAASSSEIAVGLAGDMCMSFRDGLDNHTRLSQEIIKPSARNGITADVDDRCGFDVIDSR